jgi:uncharacterized phage protein (TIGR01671 family)
MNRIIKFRGKRIDCRKEDCGKWVYGFYTKSALHGFHKIHFQLENYTWVEMDIEPDTAGQFTWTYDRNGKEIYEGDIIRKKNKHADLGLFVVEFAEGLNYSYNGFWLKRVKDGKFGNLSPDSIWFPADAPENWDEVVGNIHDDKHLLK